MPGDALERARRALAEAKADAAAKGARPVRPDNYPERLRWRGGTGRAGGSGADREPPGGTGGRSPGLAEPERLRGVPRKRRDDPQPLGTAIDGLLADQGWRQRAAVGGAFGRWQQIVGTDLAAHARPESFTDGELVVVADSTAWATQLRLLAADLVRRLNAELGDRTVLRVKVRGPSGEPGRGRWRVRDGRGPRDTYG